jgi:hypothetical protein
MNKIQISIPEGMMVDKFDEKTGELTFKAKPKAVTERIMTMDDVFKELGIDPDDFGASCKGLEPDEVAYRQLKLIALALNEGWEPDWKDNSQSKYYPWFEMEVSSSGFRFDDYGTWNADSNVGSRLCFVSRATAEHAGKQFTNVYKEFMTINSK